MAEAAATEAEGTLSAKAVDALRRERLFWMCVPRELGGEGLGLTASIEIIEEITYADGSTGWTVMANMASAAIAAAFLGEAAVEAMFGGSEPPIAAGMLGPAGKCKARDGGYEAEGKFGFGSGMGHATWIGAGMLVMEEGGPRRLPSGLPEVQVCWVPRDRVEVLGNWNVSGLIGTGSFDYLVPRQFVPGAWSFERTTLEPKRGSQAFRLGVAGAASAGHAAVALGLTRRALHECAIIADGKQRPGYVGPVAESHVFRHDFAEHEASYQGARAYVLKAFGEAEEAALAGAPVTDEHRARLRQVNTWAHHVASAAIGFAHRWAGSEALRWGTAINRVSRDMAAATQHVFVDEMTLVDAAPALLRAWKAL